MSRNLDRVPDTLKREVQNTGPEVLEGEVTGGGGLRDPADEFRFTRQADGSAALRVFLILDEKQAHELNAWFTERCVKLKADRWSGWNPGDMALRTVCVQIDAYAARAFRAVPGKQNHEPETGGEASAS